MLKYVTKNRGSEKTPTRTKKGSKNSLFSYPYRFHLATEAVLHPNGGCFTMQNSMSCSVTQAPLQPKRIFDCVLNLYTFLTNFATTSFSALYKLVHISPVRTKNFFGAEFLNLSEAIVKQNPCYLKQGSAFFSTRYSPICTAFKAAPLRIWSPESQKVRPFSSERSLRTRPTKTSSLPAVSRGMG